MPYGLTATGFSAKPLTAILSDIEAAEKATIDPTIDVSAESVVGQINGIMAGHLAELWELAEATYNARVPGNASYQTLDDLAAITGTLRAKATKGTVNLRLTVAAATTIPAGAIAAVHGSSTNRWVTLVDAVNAGGVPANVTVAAQAETAGYLPASAGTITDIAVPIAGWTAVTNIADAIPGFDTELDSALRIRRERERALGGSSPVDGVRAAVSELTGVRSVVVTENVLDTTDTYGLPPHSMEVLVDFVGAGVGQIIANTVWANKPAGIQTFLRSAALGGGGTTYQVTDAGGVTHDVNITLPTSVRVYCKANIEVVPELYDATDTALKAALAAVTDNMTMGGTLRMSDLILAGRAVPGVTDINVLIGLSVSTRMAANLTCSPRELLDLAVADIVVEVA